MKKVAIYNCRLWDGKITTFQVRILAQADGYAMVRRLNARPFVVKVKDLTEIMEVK